MLSVKSFILSRPGEGVMADGEGTGPSRVGFSILLEAPGTTWGLGQVTKVMRIRGVLGSGQSGRIREGQLASLYSPATR